MNPDEYCRQLCAKSASSFYLSFLLLPAEQQRAIMALYAFCREVDDIVDDCREVNVAAIKLAWWRDEIDRVFADVGEAPQHPVAQALLAVRRAREQAGQAPLAQRHFHEIIDGMAMDLQRQDYPDFAALKTYCYHAASAVGLLSAAIFGYQNDDTLRYAHDLGLALQLTNILRDVGEDYRRGRIYLPQDEREAAGISEELIAKGETENEIFQSFMKKQAARAHAYFHSALAALPREDCWTQRPGLVMAAIYRALLIDLESHRFPVLRSRLTIAPARKTWLALSTWCWPSRFARLVMQDGRGG